MSVAVIKKRDGRIVPFDMKKISDTIEKSFRADTERNERRAIADQLAWEITTLLEQDGNPAPSVERIQDLVEQVLTAHGHEAAAKRYILYRQARTDARARTEHGKGTVVLESWEPTLTGQAVAICAAIRNNGGAERLVGFFESLAPAAEETLNGFYTAALRTLLRTETGCAVAEQTLKTVHLAVRTADCSLVGPGRAEYLSRQRSLLSGTLGAEPEAVAKAQEAALEIAVFETEQMLRQTLRCLHARGCTRDLIARPSALSPQLELVLKCDES